MASFEARVRLLIGRRSGWATFAALFSFLAPFEILITHGYDNSVILPIISQDRSKLSVTDLQTLLPFTTDRITNSYAGAEVGLIIGFPIGLLVFLISNSGMSRSGLASLLTRASRKLFNSSRPFERDIASTCAVLCGVILFSFTVFGFAFFEPGILDPSRFFDLAYLGAFSAVVGMSVHVAIDLGTTGILEEQGRDLAHRRWLQVIQLVTWAIILTITGVVVSGGASSLTHMPSVITDSAFSDALIASQMLLIASISLGVITGIIGRIFDYLGAIERGSTPAEK